jgi:xylitol oxidase
VEPRRVSPANWAGNVVFSARRIARPASVDELRRLVARSDRIRALGTAHSFCRVADGGGLVSLGDLPADPVLAPDGSGVTLGAGMRYGELGSFLHGRGLALENLASLPHLSVGGACATATHGSGTRCLATQVSALEIVTADGELVTLRRGDADFAGAVVGLGLLGVVVRLTLDVRPAAEVRQYVYDDLPGTEHLDAVLDGGHSVSLFTDWRGPRVNQVWRKVAAPVEPGPWFGARPADGPRHPAPGVSPVTCTEQGGVPGPWHERLPHFRLDHTPSAGDELQSEFLLPRDRAAEALAAVGELADQVAPVLLISEIRSVAADELWLSMAYGRDSLALHFTWIPDPVAVLPVVAAVEQALALLDPRPHWGKISRADPELAARSYERLPDFRALVARWDPAGKFRNDLTDRWLSLR